MRLRDRNSQLRSQEVLERRGDLLLRKPCLLGKLNSRSAKSSPSIHCKFQLDKVSTCSLREERQPHQRQRDMTYTIDSSGQFHRVFFRSPSYQARCRSNQLHNCRRNLYLSIHCTCLRDTGQLQRSQRLHRIRLAQFRRYSKLMCL